MVKAPAYIEQGDIATKPSQMYGWDGAPVRVGMDVDGLKVTEGIVWDAITPTFNATSDVYAFYLNSTLVKTITISYTDATKSVMSGVTKV